MGTIVAIDGPAGSGKSSTAKLVARGLEFVYIDTGAMYRAVTLQTIKNNIDVNDIEKVIKAATEMTIKFKWIDGEHHTFIDGEDVSREIRTTEVANLVSPVSTIPAVREYLAELQRKMAKEDNVVMEGRDIGTNVFPEAEFKIFMKADVRVRAQRRISDYQKVGQEIDFEKIVEELKKRDKIDSSRKHSPLKKADDAIEIDTTYLKFEEQVEEIIKIVKEDSF